MEKAVTVVTIGLIELVAALNILITLVMMVMEKYRDIEDALEADACEQERDSSRNARAWPAGARGWFASRSAPAAYACC
jgi:hypothetical protein